MGCSQSTAVNTSAAPRPQRPQATATKATAKAKTTKHEEAPAKNNQNPAPAAGEEQQHQTALQRREVNTTIDDENSDAVAPEFAAAPPMSIRMERPVVSAVGSVPLQMPSSVRCNVSSFNISFIDPTSAPSSRGTESNIDSTSSNYNFLAAAASESKARTDSNKSVRFEEDTVTAADLVVSSEFDQEEAPASGISIVSASESIGDEETAENIAPVADDVDLVEEMISVKESCDAIASGDLLVDSQEATTAADDINAVESVSEPVDVTSRTEKTTEFTSTESAAQEVVEIALSEEIVAIDSTKEKLENVGS